MSPETQRESISREHERFELKRKLEATDNASEVLTLLSKLEDWEIEEFYGADNTNSSALRERLETIAKDVSDVRLTEVQKTLLVETVKGLEMRVHWQLRDMRGQLRGPGAKKYDGDMALGHDIDMAALQLYSFLNHIKAQQENLG